MYEWVDDPVVGPALSDYTLAGAELERANLWNVDLPGRDMGGINLDSAAVQSRYSDLLVDWAGVNLTGAHLWNAAFSEVDLTGANFTGAWLSGVWFKDSNLTGANFTNPADDGFNVRWTNTICPDGTNSDVNGGTCLGHLS
jgi:uncharacterized protein YjbI with pentapeptide repeats